MMHKMYNVVSLSVIVLPIVLTLNIYHRDTVLQSLFENYSAAIPPHYNEDIPINIFIQVYILSIDSLSDSSKDYSMSIFLRQRWTDSRLKYDNIPGVISLQLDTKLIPKVWVPDLFILNEKQAIVHNVVVPNKLLHIKPDGSILYSIRISGTFSCDVNLLKYPMDRQVCPLIIESSNFSCVKMNIKLDRVYDFYIIQTYVPTILVVILSWVSFWISIDATPARISLGLLTVLTMTTQNTGLPRVTYFKAIDVWMVSCLIFVFAALIEFAWVNVLSRVAERRRSTIIDIPDHYDRSSQNRQTNHDKVSNGSRLNLWFSNMANREKARNVDKVARVLFPVTFFLFNLIYWTVYIYVVGTCTKTKKC